MITTPLRILLVDNNPADVEVIIRHIEKIVETPDIKVVNNFKDLASQLQIFFRIWLYPIIISLDSPDWMFWN